MDGARAPRRVFSRVLGEVVPVLAGFAAGWVVLSVHGAVVGVVAGVAVGVVLSLVLRRIVRPRPLLRRLYRFALLAHVVFWSREGILATSLRPPGGVTVVATGGDRFEAFRVGTAAAPFGLADATLAGYGGRPRRAAFPAFSGFGVLGGLSRRWMEGRVRMLAAARGGEETLGARALVVLRPGGEPALALVRLDLVVVDEALVAALLERVRDLRVGADALVFVASHTHSGPGGFHAAPAAQVAATDHRDARVADRVVAAAAEALRGAVAAAVPARVAFAASRDRGADGKPVLARNRRAPDPDAIDDRVLAMRFETADGARPLAVVVNHAVHPTYLGPDHLALDRDLAGALEDALSERLGAPVLFLQAALGDVAPRRGEPGRDAMRALASAFAERVAPDLRGGEPRARLRVRTGRAEQDLGSCYAFVATGSRGRFDEDVARRAVLSDGSRAFADLLALPLNAIPWSLGLTEVRLGFSFGGPAGAVVRLDDHVVARRHAVGAVLLEAADDDAGANAHRQALLWVPAEPTTALGRRWRAHAESQGLPTPFLLALANGSIAYLTTAEEFDRDVYESRATIFGASTARRVEEALYAALAAAMR